jgi:inner membrane protein
MASPLGHALAGFVIGRAAQAGGTRDRRLLAMCAALAIAPDLDFLPGIIEGRPAAYHQGISHSLLASAAAGAAGALLLGPGRAGFARIWLICTAAYASHLLLDLLGPDARAPFGIPLFWPVSSEPFLSPVALLPGISHAATSDASNAEWLATIFSAHNLRALLFELALACPLILLTELRARRLARSPR